MLFFVLLGLLFFFFSILFFFAPHAIVKISEMGNKLLFTDHRTVAHRYWTGLVLLLLSVVMIYIGLKI